MPRSTLTQWVGQAGAQRQSLVDALSEVALAQVHADATPVPMLAPGQKKAHRAYVWAYLVDRAVPTDNNQVESKIRPWALGHLGVQLVICRVAAQWEAGGGDHDFYPVGTHEWA